MQDSCDDGNPVVRDASLGTDRERCGFHHILSVFAGNTKLPAGSYKVIETNLDPTILLIESTNGVHWVYLDITPTETEQPHPQSNVTFHKYGGIDYLNQIWVQGERSGMQADPTKAEKKAAASASAEDHSVRAKKR